jgi:hypothetical protein
VTGKPTARCTSSPSAACANASAPPRLHQTTHRRRKDQTRNHPLPQTLHRPRGLQHPTGGLGQRQLNMLGQLKRLSLLGPDRPRQPVACAYDGPTFIDLWSDCPERSQAGRTGGRTAVSTSTTAGTTANSRNTGVRPAQRRETVPARRPPGDLHQPNSIEALHRQIRKIIKTGGHFPTKDAARKLLTSRSAQTRWRRVFH